MPYTYFSNSENDDLIDKGQFSLQDKKIRETIIDNGIMMRLESNGLSIVRIYFVNDLFDEITIPNGLVIRDVTNNVALKPHRNNFYISWTDNYKISFNNEVVIDMTTDRQWSLRGLDERVIRTID